MPDMDSADVVVIGAGIAGAAVAAELTRDGRVILIEREEVPGYHSTGRSSAVLAQTYGNRVVRQLTRASLDLFFEPPVGFAPTPLVKPKPIMRVARAGQVEMLRKLLYENDALDYWRHLTGPEVREAAPLLRPDYGAEALINRSGQEIDVSALHQGYLRSFRDRGGVLILNAPVTQLMREGSLWSIGTPVQSIKAPTIVNAGGAWADEIGALAGASRLGLTPMRRTALIVPAPKGISVSDHPMVVDAEEQFYLKPDAGRLLLSPADETPSAACDSQPEEWDVAIAVDRIERAFELKVRRIESRWAGLRTFAPDRTPVCGFDLSAKGFFWLAGQGGYGVQTAPAMARLARCLVGGGQVHPALETAGLDASDLAPHRLRRAA